MNNEEKLLKYCQRNLNFKKLNQWPPEEYLYEHLSLCVVDAVFSINAKYESVKNIIKRIRMLDVLSSLLGFKAWTDGQSDSVLETKYFNRSKIAQRLKVDILKDFVKILLKFKFYKKSDFINFINRQELENELKGIRGIGETTISYFFMLSGDENTIKPDRHVKKFIADGLNIPLNQVNEDYARNILEKVLSHLKKENNLLSLRSLDHLIWNFQRGQTKRK